MRKILIVDDSTTMRRMVKASLARLPDVDFEEAASGLEAIERLTLTRVALMVLDMNMPDIHGLEVLAFLRSHPNLGQIPVIVLTTRSDDDSRTAALVSGATLYLTKPFVPSVLAGTVLELLEKQHAGWDASQKV